MDDFLFEKSQSPVRLGKKPFARALIGSVKIPQLFLVLTNDTGNLYSTLSTSFPRSPFYMFPILVPIPNWFLRSSLALAPVELSKSGSEKLRTKPKMGSEDQKI